MQRVRDGEALAEELGVPGDLDGVAGRRQRAGQRAEACGGTDRNMTAGPVSSGDSRLTTWSTYVMSAAYSPSFCGVPTPRKWTGPHAAASS
jgi:hypothetical protein